MTFNKLTPKEEQIIVHKGTEPAFSGKYFRHTKDGTYVCKRCSAPLYSSEHKFESKCGWPSFDGEVAGAVKRQPDADGIRTEILCGRCGGHLGHLFLNEGLTKTNVRHCVNSLALDFAAPKREAAKTTDKAYFAAGCFWGVEHIFANTKGVTAARSGYMGGSKVYPTYKEVCRGNTGHAEAVEVEYDPSKTSYEALARLFFEIHDPGAKPPSPRYQYRSAAFCTDAEQKKTIQKLVKILTEKDIVVRTQINNAGTFWPAEEYHQDYFRKQGKEPTCHRATKLFDD